MNMKVTYQQVVNFRNAARQYLGQKPDQTKLQYAINKMLKATESIQQKYSDEEQDIRIDLAEVDKTTGVLIITNEKGYAYTKENAKKLNTKIRALGLTEVEVDFYHAKELPKSFESVWLEFFVPFVIEDKEPE